MIGVKNQIKTFMLLSVLTGLLLVIGALLGGRTGLFFGLVFAIIMNFGAWFFSDKIVLAIYRAKQVKEKEAPRLYKIVKEVSSRAGLPMPRVYIIPTDSSNAFATGRNYKHAAVAATKGILELLNDEELKGVIAHEISHVKNKDTLIQTIAATIAGVISYIAMMARWGAIFGGIGGDREEGSSGLIEILVLAVLAPIIATIIQLAISRSREYLADNSAANLLHNGDGLASALAKLDKDIKRNPLKFGSPATSSLFIANPFSGQALVNLFSTHPPMNKRISRLKEINF